MAKLSNMVDVCQDNLRGQIQKEIDASINYLAMVSYWEIRNISTFSRIYPVLCFVFFFSQGAYFSQDRVNRPGFAKFFFHAASEEREHAYKLIQYLLMRGNLRHDLLETIQLNKVVSV